MRFALAASAAALVASAPAADKVASLPGIPSLLTSTYSGYLSVGGGKHLHYLFYASQSSTAATDPVVLWLNGGPGCSSLEGAFQEPGPLWTMAGGKSLQLNNYSWNKFANQLFIEAPACVGFSYADDPSTGCTHTDTSTAADNLQAMIQFYTKFPELAANPFWISGESYAGIYIPMLAYNIYNYNLKAPAVPIALKGILVGNGCIGNDVGVCGQDSYSDYLSLFQLYRHVMISDPTWATVIDKCGDFSKESPACQKAIDNAGNEAGNNFNVYDIYSGVWGVCAASALKNPRRPVRAGSVMAKLLAAQAAATPANQCTDDDDLTTYMNLPAVQKALNVQPTTWGVCANINYSGDMPDERKEIYPTLTQKAGYQVLIYNGDADACVPVTDNMYWTKSMNYSTVTPWTAWTTPDGTLAGYVTQYDYNFTFTTIRLAGHMVPQTQPIAAYAMAYTHITGGSWTEEQ